MMVESFEEFLKKHEIGFAIPSHFTDYNEAYRKGQEDFAKDLGDWAFDNAYGRKWNVGDDAFYVYREIALDCLGKAEVEKKLNENEKVK